VNIAIIICIAGYLTMLAGLSLLPTFAFVKKRRYGYESTEKIVWISAIVSMSGFIAGSLGFLYILLYSAIYTPK
jgi:hypothetical protein